MSLRDPTLDSTPPCTNLHRVSGRNCHENGYHMSSHFPYSEVLAFLILFTSDSFFHLDTADRKSMRSLHSPVPPELKSVLFPACNSLLSTQPLHKTADSRTLVLKITTYLRLYYLTLYFKEYVKCHYSCVEEDQRSRHRRTDLVSGRL